MEAAVTDPDISVDDWEVLRHDAVKSLATHCHRKAMNIY